MTSVSLTYLHPNTVSHNFMQSVLGCFSYDKRERGILGSVIPVRSGPLNLDYSRNKAMATFLDDSDSEWLWIVDTDIGFRPESLYALLDADRPVISGIYNCVVEGDSDGCGGASLDVFPSVFKYDGSSFIAVEFDGTNLSEPIDGAGAGFLLIHRSVAEAVRERFGDDWFTRMPREGYSPPMWGEDFSFSLRLLEMGIQMFAHTQVKLTHHKEVWL